MKVLIYCPTYKQPDGELALRDETRASLEKLKRGRHQVTVEISVDETPDRRHNIMRQYQRAWEMANAGGYDALLTVEHDMVIPADALLKLAEADADIAYGVYLFRESGYLNAMRIGEEVLFDASLDLHAAERAEAFAAAAPYPVQGAGMGCTLIRASVFTTIPLRQPRGGPFPDLPMAADAQAAGLKQMAHFGVICGHVRPDGVVLWPDPTGRGVIPYTLPCLALSTFTGEWGGRRHFVGQGKKLEIPAYTATQLALIGLVKIYPDKEK